MYIGVICICINAQMVVKNIVSNKVTFMSSICHHQMKFCRNIVIFVGSTIGVGVAAFIHGTELM